MKTEKLPLIFTITAALAGGIGAVFLGPVMALVGMILAIFGAIWQDRMSTAYVRHVSADDWLAVADKFTISISARQHHHGIRPS